MFDVGLAYSAAYNHLRLEALGGALSGHERRGWWWYGELTRLFEFQNQWTGDEICSDQTRTELNRTVLPFVYFFFTCLKLLYRFVSSFLIYAFWG